MIDSTRNGSVVMGRDESSFEFQVSRWSRNLGVQQPGS